MFRPLILLGGCLVMLVLVSTGAAYHSPWPDARHGWEVRGNPETNRPPHGLYSTEDGGRHWHLIYPDNGSDIMGWLRTSTNAGVMSIDYKAPEQYWTRDNGRHWYLTRRLPPLSIGGVGVAGKGHLLFWSRFHVLYQVRNWPPAPRAELRLRAASRVPDGTFTDLVSIPAGVAGVILRQPDAPAAPLARVLLHRARKTRVIRLRDPDPASAARVRALTLFASWPELTVLGEDERGIPVVTWTSYDGGKHWGY